VNDNSIYRNKIAKEINNNEFIYYSKNKSDIEANINIYKKISKIFNSKDYVYKADVFIKTIEGIQEKTIIGRNKNYLITASNELIPIKDILDINKKQS